jgi:hypothetical protein
MLPFTATVSFFAFFQSQLSFILQVSFLSSLLLSHFTPFFSSPFLTVETPPPPP